MSNNFIERMKKEADELSERIFRLIEFTETDFFKKLHNFERVLLEEQLVHMQNYLRVLNKRLMFYKKG